MKYCPKCAKHSRDSAVLCIYCGSSFALSYEGEDSKEVDHSISAVARESTTIVEIVPFTVPQVSLDSRNGVHTDRNDVEAKTSAATPPSETVAIKPAIEAPIAASTNNSSSKSALGDLIESVPPGQSAATDKNSETVIASGALRLEKRFCALATRPGLIAAVTVVVFACAALLYLQFGYLNEADQSPDVVDEVIDQPVVVPAEALRSAPNRRERPSKIAISEKEKSLANTVSDAERALSNKDADTGQVGLPKRDRLALIVSLPPTDEYYPKSLISPGVAGSANVKVCINQEGSIQELPTIVKSSGNIELDLAAVSVVRAGRFSAEKESIDGNARYCAIVFVEFRQPKTQTFQAKESNGDPPIVIAASVDDTFSNCSYPSERPLIPNGRTASFAEMMRAQKLVKEYDRLTTQFQNCIKSRFSNGLVSEDLRGKEGAGVRRVNETYSDVEKLVEELNEQIKIFRRRTDSTGN